MFHNGVIKENLRMKVVKYLSNEKGIAKSNSAKWKRYISLDGQRKLQEEFPKLNLEYYAWSPKHINLSEWPNKKNHKHVCVHKWKDCAFHL